MLLLRLDDERLLPELLRLRLLALGLLLLLLERELLLRLLLPRLAVPRLELPLLPPLRPEEDLDDDELRDAIALLLWWLRAARTMWMKSPSTDAMITANRPRARMFPRPVRSRLVFAP